MKRELVVYLLGAGFSAPLGLPVMSNFLEKSKDLFFLEGKLSKDQREYFKNVFQAIHDMSVVKNYYTTDLFNIEEILSILTMQQSLGGGGLSEAFLRYITDVIRYYTPPIPPLFSSDADEWHKGLFSTTEGPARFYRFYGFFVGSLLQLSVPRPQGEVNRYHKRTVDYGVVTLNYDLVLERFARSFQETNPDSHFSFRRATEEFQDDVPLAKLHGSVDTEVIVPPTWNKDVNQKLLPDWTTAFDRLSKANHLRIIGYSLPTSDAYIRYLLRAAAIESEHLKKIDVLCWDDRRNSVRARYQEFVDPARLRFVSGDVTDYLRAVYDASAPKPSADQIELRHLEATHHKFFEAHAD